MSNSNWNYPTTVWFGEGRIKDLHIACKNLGITKPLFVTDKDLAKTDLVKKIISLHNGFVEIKSVKVPPTSTPAI